ncbi:phosphoglycerate mutase-like protein [Hypoxylon trugodes]|uniref:phosphoglycerate mutase-like protein n=1 Tax=Hypoxylon trugodes TaxID=326681 RepID=UPI00218D70AE|nr:phosphoglycerate mutase-like protein [Hypoxylon trugodes]KAI1386389.1 phosphoglycerate mutase-like protein [Hypoxylon trugodes]
MVFTDLRRQLTGFVTGGRHNYTPLPGNATRSRIQKRFANWVDNNRVGIRFMLCILLSVILIAFSTSFMSSLSTQECRGFIHDRHCKKEISRSWGQYSSSFSVPSKIPASIPGECVVSFAQLLSRHGARDPTAHKSLAYAAVIDRIQNDVKDYSGNLKFIKDYKYTLGADQLTLYGEQQMVDSGVKFYERYRNLAGISIPFIRASGQERVVESAQNWTQGFHQARSADSDYNFPDPYPYNILIIPEEDNFNNSLSPDLCPAFENTRHDNDDEQSAWIQTFVPPLTERLNRQLPGANLSDEETIYMMDLCPFNTVANAKGKLSEFCNLFTVDEWRDYDYYQSLGKWYGYGNGSPLGPTQGVGFVNELIARLTGQPVIDHTTTNSTLDRSESTFPLHYALYADFSHDNDMMDIFSTLGLYNLTDALPGDHRVSAQEAKGFSASWVVPFAARLYVEKMVCWGSTEELVRILVNDRVVPLQNCDADELGRCTVSKFVESQSFARNGGHWDQCFV